MLTHEVVMETSSTTELLLQHDVIPMIKICTHQTTEGLAFDTKLNPTSQKRYIDYINTVVIS
jgi:hypothetical protein